ncbi:MAG: hypothetical protein NTY64_05205 [Deltaproteobacteria bacterium]|nr:hypothetical protein [Deltaproteobacteria bacterium]
MGRYDDDDDREKLSWREIDKLRDHSRQVGDRRSYQERTLRSDWAKKQHLREAEKFFQGKKGTEAYKKAHAALNDHYGTPQFQKAAQEFLQEFGLPDDWGTLLLLLDYPDPTWAKGALSALRGLYEKRSLIEQKGFKGKMKNLVMTTKNRDLRQECEKIIEEL